MAHTYIPWSYQSKHGTKKHAPQPHQSGHSTHKYILWSHQSKHGTLKYISSLHQSKHGTRKYIPWSHQSKHGTHKYIPSSHKSKCSAQKYSRLLYDLMRENKFNIPPSSHQSRHLQPRHTQTNTSIHQNQFSDLASPCGDLTGLKAPTY